MSTVASCCWVGVMSVACVARGATFAAVVVEQFGFFDAGEFVEQFAHRHVQAGVGGVAAHQVGDGQGQHAVEHVHPDLGVGPVVHRAE